jgi:putative peptidoglycan lipid II flippase
VPTPGWVGFLVRLTLALVALAAALWFGSRGIDWTAMQGAWAAQAALLAALVAGGAAVYGVVLLLLGFRPRDFVSPLQ